MAATPAGARLTETHRLTQLRVGALTARQMTLIWPLLDLHDLNQSFPGWLTAAQAVIGTQRRISASVAAGYLTTFRRMELGSTQRLDPIIAEQIEPAKVATSMLVTGPISIRANLKRGVDLAVAANTANARSAGAAMRHALGGGRDTISQTVAADPRARGWARVASGRACDFCASLASGGVVFSEEAVDFQAHDHCSCSAEPAY